LEETVKDSVAGGEGYYRRIVELDTSVRSGVITTGSWTHIKDDEQNKVDAIKNDKDPEQPPGSFTGEE